MDAAASIRRPRPSAVTTARAATALLGLAIAIELACALALALGAADAHRLLVPASRHMFPGWLQGPLPRLDENLTEVDIGALLVVMAAAYGGTLALAPRVGGRWPLAVCAAAIAICALAPPLFSADLFGYIAWGELGAHGVNPYNHASIAVGHGAVRPFLLWHHGITPYGPLFTATSFALAPLGVAVGLWTLKAVAALCALACVVLLWRTALRLGRPAAPAALALGLNPLVLVYGVGGAHNDLMLEALVLAGVLAMSAGRVRTGAGVVVSAVAVKASAVFVLPFLIAGSPRVRRPLLAAVATGGALLACAFVIFGTPLLNIVGELGSQQHDVAVHSIPAELARLLGATGVPAWGHLLADALLLATVVALLVRTRRGADWLTSAGWAFVALLLTTAWLLPWYVAWAVPFAALASDRRLLAAVWGLTLLIIVLRLPLLG